MKNILVIGSTGQIGSELTMKLRRMKNIGTVVAGYVKGFEPKGELLASGPSELADVCNAQQIADVVDKYQIDTIKKDGSDYIIAAMSGNWVQRGGPAIIDKYSRTLMALKGGVDLVLEIPTIYSTGSASDYAMGGVSLLDSLGCVDELCFGCEAPDEEALDKVTDFMFNHQDELTKEISAYTRQGYNYPKARELALSKYFDEHTIEGLSKPNNILAIEYKKALHSLNSKIATKAILRQGSNYSDTTLNINSYSSATAIRENILSSYDHVTNDDSYVHGEEPSVSTYMSLSGAAIRQAMSEPLSPILNHVPSYSYEILLEKLGKTYPLVTQNFSRELAYKLIHDRVNGYEQYLDVSREIADKISNNLNYFESFDQFCNLLKSKEITYSRVSRSLTHILLDIKTSSIPEDKKTPYARILGFRKDSEALFSLIKKNASIPIISKSILCFVINRLLITKNHFTNTLYTSSIK